VKTIYNLRIVTLSIFLLLLIDSAVATTFYVDDEADCNDTTGNPYYCTIQTAIDSASAGDIVEVASGTYRENISISKQLTVHGTDKTTTTIDAGGIDTDVVSITANDVTLNSFTLQNANGVEVNGVYMHSVSGCTISNLIITDITGTFRAHGIHADYANMNAFSDITISGLTETSPQVTIGDAAFGIILTHSSNNTFTAITIDNLTADNDPQGIFLYSSCDYNEFNNILINNLTSANAYPCGINIWSKDPNPSSNYNTFTNILISNLNGSSSVYGIQNRATADDTNTGNKFINTTINCLTSTADVVLVIYNEYATDSEFTDTYSDDITADTIAIGINNAYTFDNTIIGGGNIHDFSANIWSAGLNFVASTSDALVENMTISGVDRGIRISSSADASQISVHYNNILENTEYGLLNEGTESVNAENNWWGDIDPSDDVSGAVDYTPWIFIDPTQEYSDMESTSCNTSVVSTVTNTNAGIELDVGACSGAGMVGTASYTMAPPTSTGLKVGTGNDAIKYFDVFLSGISGDVKITVSYSKEEVAHFDESALNLYMWYDNKWNLGSNPGRNIDTQTVWGTFPANKLTGTPGSLASSPHEERGRPVYICGDHICTAEELKRQGILPTTTLFSQQQVDTGYIPLDVTQKIPFTDITVSLPFLGTIPILFLLLLPLGAGTVYLLWFKE